MLNHKFRHYLPCFSSSSISIMCSINLSYIGKSHYFLCLTSIYKRPYHVYIPIQNIILWVLMCSIDSFLSKHYCYFRTSNTTYIWMVINRSTNFFFYKIKSLPLSSYLFSCYWNSTYTLWSSFYKPIKMWLSSSSDNH